MKLIAVKLLILIASCVVLAQDEESKVEMPARGETRETKENLDKIRLKSSDGTPLIIENASGEKSGTVSAPIIASDIRDFGKVEPDFREPEPAKYDDGEIPPPAKEKFHWKPALIQSGIFLGIQHGSRIFQKKTRDGLDGPFFREWGESVRGLRTWDDGGLFFTNYVAHPLQGGLTGRIFINNSDRAKKQEFGKSKKYWESRAKAMAWSAFWSTQFEIGPISEASFGNVGKSPTLKYGKMGWNDIVITPVLGTGVVVGEDIIEKYVLRNWLEKKLTSRTRIKLWRTVLTPTTSFSNILRGKMPWKRDNRY